MTRKTVEQLLNEHGHAYLDMNVAREFAKVSGKTEEQVLGILREQEEMYLRRDSGRGKFHRARERACVTLADGWEQAHSLTEQASTLLRTRDFAYVYAVLVWRELSNDQSRTKR